jgi:PDZ domain
MGRNVNFQLIGPLSAVLLLSGCAGIAPEASPDSVQAAGMSLSEARLVVKNRSVTDFLPEGIVVGDNPASILSCRYEELDPAVYRRDGKNVVNWGPQCRYGLTFPANESANARQFASALLRWKSSTFEERQAWHEIQQQVVLNAERYRTAAHMPVLPEEVRRFKVLAEAAVKEGRFADAARAYEFGVEHAPWWAEGHFNAAIVLGQIHHYAAAIDHMQKYLILKPNAADARAAQDQIYAWGGGAVPPVSRKSPSVQLGVSVGNTSSPVAANAVQKPDRKGASIVAVMKGSVAEKIGLSMGDVIVEYGGKPIANNEDLLIAVFMTKPHSTVPIKFVRESQELTVTARF